MAENLTIEKAKEKVISLLRDEGYREYEAYQKGQDNSFKVLDVHKHALEDPVGCELRRTIIDLFDSNEIELKDIEWNVMCEYCNSAKNIPIYDWRFNRLESFVKDYCEAKHLEYDTKREITPNHYGYLINPLPLNGFDKDNKDDMALLKEIIKKRVESTTTWKLEHPDSAFVQVVDLTKENHIKPVKATQKEDDWEL